MHNPPIFIVNYGAHYSLGGCANAGFSDLNQLVFEYVCSNFFQIFVNQTTFNYFHLFIGGIFVISYPIENYWLNLINVTEGSLLYYSLLAFSGDLGLTLLKIGQVRYCYDSQIWHDFASISFILMGGSSQVPLDINRLTALQNLFMLVKSESNLNAVITEDQFFIFLEHIGLSSDFHFLYDIIYRIHISPDKLVVVDAIDELINFIKSENFNYEIISSYFNLVNHDGFKGRQCLELIFKLQNK